MIDALIAYCEKAGRVVPGRVELRGVVSYLRDRAERLRKAQAQAERSARVLARAVEEHAQEQELAAGADVFDRVGAVLMSSDEVTGRPMCVSGCTDRLVLVIEGAARCAVCDSIARTPEERAA